MNLRHETLVDMLAAAERCDATLTFVADDDTVTTVPMARLHADALGLARVLRAGGVSPGDRVPIMVGGMRDFVRSFFAVLLAGATPCPLAPASGLGRADETAVRTRAVLRYLRCRHLVASASVTELLGDSVADLSIIEATAHDDAGAVPLPTLDAAATAMIQCTSGSTGLPKGVMLSHTNLLANMHQIGLASRMGAGDVGVTWLPLHHDMGLIGCLLAFIYWQVDLVMMTPTKFLRRPVTWLRAISHYRGTLSAAPNFAYEYATSRIPDDQLDGLDLSSWRVAVCGSEPVRPATVARFTARFASRGLRPDVIVPCYGLAECSLMVTAEALGSPIQVDHPAGEPGPFASSGLPVSDTRVRVVGPDGAPGAQDDAAAAPLARPQIAPQIGRLQVSGPSVMQGYFDAPDLTRQVLRDGWLDTGDLGYLKDGRLYVTGREKDCIILRGKCYAPALFEWAAEEAEGIRRGSVAALGLTSAEAGTELLHLVCETRVKEESARDRLRAEVAALVSSQTGVVPSTVHLVRPGAVPKTTSGKIRRGEMRRLLTAGALPLALQE